MLIYDNISKNSHTGKEKGLQPGVCNPLISLARPEGFEPSTSGFVVRRSIQLSYGRTLKVRCECIPRPVEADCRNSMTNEMAERGGFEPPVHLLRRTIA